MAKISACFLRYLTILNYLQKLFRLYEDETVIIYREAKKATKVLTLDSYATAEENP
jgi:hypothetical protein